MPKKRKEITKFVTRPPIVAVLGHVDHGKTTLLDKIRKTRVAEREPGGITQSIGAYQVRVPPITFIDTPGHVAFSKMRARGGKISDLVVLVVAANDGVMPQTIESLEHIKVAGVPFLVAINKIDLPGVDLEKVKKQLVDNGVLVEGYGGDVVVVPVSAKTGQGIDELLEMILLLAEMKEIKANPEGPLEAVVIESKRDKRGTVGTVLVRDGTLKVADQILVENVPARVRGMMNESGKLVKKALPGQPVEVLGFTQVPPVGAKVAKVEALPKPKLSIDEIREVPKLPKESQDKLNIILKTDSLGSFEAISESLPGEIFVVSHGVGDINESDVLFAQATKAQIFGFKVKATSQIIKLAEDEGVKIKTFKIIYEFLEDLEKEVLKVLEPTIEEEILGRAEIVAEFQVGGERVAGCRVLEGKIRKTDKLHLKRKDKILGDTKIVSMKHQKEDISEAKKGTEFGAIFSPPLDFKIGDMLISFNPIES